MSNCKCTPILISTLDTTDYLGTKTNIASTILQSTKKFKSFGFLNIPGIPPLFWLKIQRSLKIQCLTISAHTFLNAS